MTDIPLFDATHVERLPQPARGLGSFASLPSGTVVQIVARAGRGGLWWRVKPQGAGSTFLVRNDQLCS